MPTPSPTPVPVFIVDPAPAFLSAEWWIDAGIPLIGALGSIAVAVVAVAVTLRLARWERADRLRQEGMEEAERTRERERQQRESEQRDSDRRADFFAVLSEIMTRWQVMPIKTKSEMDAKFTEINATIQAAAVRSTPDAHAVGRWFIQEATACAELVERGIPGLPPRSNHAAAGWRIFSLMIGNRLRPWVRSGALDRTALMKDITLVPERDRDNTVRVSTKGV